MRIAIIGLGKLGLPMAAVYASKGHKVIGVDNNLDLIAKLNKGECPYQETGLTELLLQQRISFTNHYRDLLDTDIAFVIVPTPTGTSGTFANTYIEKSLKELQGYKGLVVIVSTVMPGSCSKFKKKYDLKIVYNPEFIALGSVIQNMLHPDSILIGEEGNEADVLEIFHHTIHGAPIYRMSYENAELAKLALNCYVTTKITFANQLAEICEGLQGGDIDDVVKFLGSDSRIGSKYLVSGTGFGGPCFPRDNVAFLSQFGEYDLQRAVVAYNRKIAIRLSDIAEQMVSDISHPKIAVLGITYKPNTNQTTDSQALKLVKHLERECLVNVYDPSVVSDLQQALKYADLAIIATPWDEFSCLDLSKMRHKRVLDCWRILTNKEDCEVYKAVGVQS